MTTQAELEYNVFTIKLQTQQFFRRNGLDGLVVRVEGQTDEAFWRPLIEAALPNKSLQFFPYFDEANTTTGKHDVVKYIGFGDKQLIFCIDSDADYLLENPILQTPFVFHTYADAIENYWCYADGLADVFKRTTDSEGISFDFVQFFETYSQIVYPYLLCALFSTAEKDGQLSHKELCKRAKFDIIKKPQQDLSDFKQKLESEFGVLLKQYKFNLSFVSFKKRLTDLGLTEQNAYLFVRGHDVFEGVFMPLMQHLGRDFDTAHFKMLSSNQEKAAYQKNRKSYLFDIVAQNNPKMTQCSFYERIIQDIQRAFQN